MIYKWKIDSNFTPTYQDRFIASIKGDREDIIKVVNKFREICQMPFPLNEEDFNWGFYIVNSTREQRKELERYLKTIQAQTEETTESPKVKSPKEEEENLTDILKEIGGVIKGLSSKGLTKEEIEKAAKLILEREFSIPGFDVTEGEQITEDITKEVGTIKPMYLDKEGGIPEEPLIPQENLVRVGYIYPEKEDKKIEAFINGLRDILKTVIKKPLALEEMYSQSYTPAEERWPLKKLLDIYQKNKLEILLILTPDNFVWPEGRNISEGLKKLPRKRKVFMKVIALKKIVNRSTYVDLAVDIGLVKGRGMDDFQS